MDFESATLRLGSPDPLALDSGALGSERITGGGSNHRRSSFTEYRSLLSSSLLDRSSPPLPTSTTTTTTTTSTTTTTRPSYLSSSLRDEPPLFTSSYTTGSKYKSYDKYLTSSATMMTSHLDDNNPSGCGASKYSFLDDALTSSSSKLANANHHHHEPISSSSLFNHSNSSLGTQALSKYNTTTNTTGTTGLSGLNLDSRFATTSNSNNLIGTTSATTTTASKHFNTTTTTSNTTTGNTKLLVDEEMAQIHELVDSIEIPARGRCKVFMAKYGYDPFKQSPNDNPDAELALNAGDYVMVFDDIDEDGYFIGELMDGRRGYVPSNWLYRLTSDDLFEFQASVLYRQAGQPEGSTGAGLGLDSNDGNLKSTGLNSLLQSAGLFAGSHNDRLLIGDDNANSLLDGVGGAHQNSAYPPEFYDAIISDTMNHSNFQHLLAPEDYHRMNDYVDLDDVNEVDDECLSDYERAEAEQMRRAVPPPQRLVLERQLNKCILIAWLHPQAAKGTIVSYQVYVDGVLKSTVPSGDRTKALLEGVDSNIPHRISVRAIDLNGRHSNDAGCTIVIGQKIPFAPSCVKASHITSDSALISWLPCNSNFHHVVAVNSVEVQTVRPGVYKHLINGLSANTIYRVWVRAKPGKILSIDEKNPNKLESLTTYVDFKTMPKSLPDPPVNVQVEAGPQRRTLLVTWLPLTLNDYGGSSNGCAVTGYAVFAGHKKLAEIDSPTGDHALLDIGDLESLHKKSVTVRTKSGENLSQDSMPCQIPDEYLKQARDVSAPGSNTRAHHSTSGHQRTHHQAPISQSPSRQRMQQASASSNLRRYNPITSIASQQNNHQSQTVAAARRVSRPLTRSLHNLESDLESRRSSIPPYELNARETSGSELMNQTESYSEEEFENSMRFRGSSRGRSGGGGQSSRAGQGHLNRLRARQSHSVDRNHHLANQFNGSGQLTGPQSRQMNAQTQMMNQQRFRSSATSSTPVGEIRFFVALFDYDPSTMSPNPNAINEELAFKEGSIIKVYGGLGEDGFYKGELLDSRATGFVPCNVITEITDTNLLASLYEKNNLLQPMGAVNQVPIPAQQSNSLGGATAASRQQQTLDQMQQQPAGVALGQTVQNQTNQTTTSSGGAVKRMVALYDYDPQENSPNADTESEIPFKTGDIIFVYGKMDTDGFYMGEVERTKQRGLVPSNFLREEPLPLSKQQQMMQMQQQLGGGAAAAKQMALATGAQQFSGQQQQMNANYQQQLRANQSNLIRGQMATNINQQQQQQQPQNVNRPNSLSLNAQASNPQQQQQMIMMNNQQMALQMQQNGLAQPQQAMQQNNAQFGIGTMQNMTSDQMGQTGVQFVGSNNMVTNRPQMMMNPQQQQQSQLQGLNQQQMNLQRQQQQQLGSSNQQQSGSGVLSNLLSSGKQIIGATMPRLPSQPGSFPSGGAPTMMGPNLNQQLNQQARDMMMANNQMPLDNTQANFGLSGTRMNQQQQQQQQMQQPMTMNPNMIGQQQLQQQPQQQQSYVNQMSGGGMNNFGRPGGMSGGAGMLGGTNQMGEEQGANLLSTVKNMFKL